MRHPRPRRRGLDALGSAAAAPAVWTLAALLAANPAARAADDTWTRINPGAVFQGAAHISSTNTGPNQFLGLNINSLLGADRFYNAGYTGTRAVVSNIEAGHLWNGHETLTHNTEQFQSARTTGSDLGEIDRHATWAAQAMAGRSTFAGGVNYQQGIAHGATLWSGAIATDWNGSAYSLSFNFNGFSFVDAYAAALVAGIGGRTTDVINSSWGFGDPAGTNFFSIASDALIRQSARTVVFSAGNSGPTSNTVGGPGSGYNAIVVGALGPDTGLTPYGAVTSFSSRGPQSFQAPGGAVVTGARARVDIVAPGQNLTLAFYGGTTGGNEGGAASGGPNFYSFNTAGTSFAAPLVAGGAALLCDVGRDVFAENANAIDGRVIKAVLLNSADKLAGWSNGQVDNGGVVETSQALDYAQGAGRMNLDRAFDQYTAGTTDVAGTGGGAVEAIGWDFGIVSQGAPNDYLFTQPLLGGTSITGTLTWFADRYINVTDVLVLDDSLDDLNLQLWRASGGLATTLVAQSASQFNSTEHFFLTIPTTGEYLLRVVWAGERYDQGTQDVNQQAYGLAWSATAAQVAVTVPEPGTNALLGAVGILGAVALRRRRARRRTA